MRAMYSLSGPCDLILLRAAQQLGPCDLILPCAAQQLGSQLRSHAAIIPLARDAKPPFVSRYFGRTAA